MKIERHVNEDTGAKAVMETIEDLLTLAERDGGEEHETLRRNEEGNVRVRLPDGRVYEIHLWEEIR